MNKEQIYDEQISPLMAQVIEICKAHKIGVLASFAIPIPEDFGLRCTTALLEDEYLKDADRPKDYLAALQMIRDGFVAFTRTVR